MIKIVGTLIWTASAAGWAVLAYLTDLPSAALVCIACLIMAAMWNEFLD